LNIRKLVRLLPVIVFAAAVLPALISLSRTVTAQISPMPTSTFTPMPQTPTDTPLPTLTDTPVPPTPTDTPAPPTDTPPPPTNTPTPIPAPPTLGSIVPDPPDGVVPVGTYLDFTVVFTDPSGTDLGLAIWDWGDGDLSECPPNATGCTTDPGTGYRGTFTGRHAYAQPGVYTVRATIFDKFGQFDTSIYQFVVVYDPSAGFVTGGGWIDSRPGAYIPDPSLAGRATFGFVSRYRRGATSPTGNTEFQFSAAGLNFHSENYDWLVVAEHKAMYKGTGTINGAGDYGFLLSVIDAALTPSTDSDLFRIKIWAKDLNDAIVYDNQSGDADDADPSTAIGGGSIVIHNAPGK
jgi:hypothetical protein